MVSGPSGTGKGTICAALAEDPRILLSVSMTTRAPRGHEVEGKNYYFVDKARFEEIIAEGGFFEFAEIYGEFYGTPKAPVLEHIEKGGDAILEIDVDGATQIKECLPEAVLVFIMPPSPEELRRRIEARGTESPERIAVRLERADSEIAKMGGYQYCVVNDKLRTAIGDVAAIMRAEKIYSGGRKPGLMSLADMLAVRRAAKLRVCEQVDNYLERYKAGKLVN